MSHSKEEVRPLEDYQEIGHRWKCSNVWSLVILIGRGLDLEEEETEVGSDWEGLSCELCSFEGVEERASEEPQGGGELGQRRKTRV